MTTLELIKPLMPELQPYVSVITTTWNRAKYLPRVHAGLLKQTFCNFEWIVADDGSDDGTAALVTNLASASSFSVVFVRASVHVGKARMDNEAVAAARGKFIVWCDSDDYFLPEALSAFVNGWDSIPLVERHEFVGIVALCESAEKTLNEKITELATFDAKLSELEHGHQMKEDGSMFLRAEILKRYRFPEVDLVIPESAVWAALGKWKLRVLTQIVKKVEYNAEHCISFSKGMKYNRGRAYAMAIAIKNQPEHMGQLTYSVWKTINFLRYCIHGDIGVTAARRLWGQNTSLFLLVASVFPAALLVLKDQLQGKVVKTHLEFEQSARIAKIDSQIFNSK